MGLTKSRHAHWDPGRNLREREYWSVPKLPRVLSLGSSPPVYPLLSLPPSSLVWEPSSHVGHQNLLLTGLPKSTLGVLYSERHLETSSYHTLRSHAHHGSCTPPSSATLLLACHNPATLGSACFPQVPGSFQPLGPGFIALYASLVFL